MDGIIIDIAVGFIDVNLVISVSSMEMLWLTYFCGVVRCGCCRVAAMWCLCLLVWSMNVGGGLIVVCG
jgi:hypothetical protein